MSIFHIQKTYCYCCGCREDIIVDEYKVWDGNEFLKVDPTLSGWKRFILKDGVYWLCPKHDLDVHIFINGKTFEIQPKEYRVEDYKPNITSMVGY